MSTFWWYICSLTWLCASEVLVLVTWPGSWDSVEGSLSLFFSVIHLSYLGPAKPPAFPPPWLTWLTINKWGSMGGAIRHECIYHPRHRFRGDIEAFEVWGSVSWWLTQSYQSREGWLKPPLRPAQPAGYYSLMAQRALSVCQECWTAASSPALFLSLASPTDVKHVKSPFAS